MPRPPMSSSQQGVSRQFKGVQRSQPREQKAIHFTAPFELLEYPQVDSRRMPDDPAALVLNKTFRQKGFVPGAGEVNGGRIPRFF
mgnify:FL=1